MRYVGSDMYEVQEGNIKGIFSLEELINLTNNFLNHENVKIHLDTITHNTLISRTVIALENELEELQEEFNFYLDSQRDEEEEIYD